MHGRGSFASGALFAAVALLLVSVLAQIMARDLWTQNREQWLRLAAKFRHWRFVGRRIEHSADYFASEKSFLYNYRLAYIMLRVVAVGLIVLAVLDAEGVHVFK